VYGRASAVDSLGELKMRKLVLAIVACAGLGSAVPADAALLNFQLSGSQQATFQIDTDTIPNFSSANALIGNQVRFDNVSGIFGGVATTLASISFGTNLIADLNIAGTALGFTQLSGNGPDLFTGDPADPVFTLGSFNLGNPFFGQRDVLTISAAVPEPSTWAMMLLGFAGLGVAAYRRTSKAAAIAA